MIGKGFVANLLSSCSHITWGPASTLMGNEKATEYMWSMKPLHHSLFSSPSLHVFDPLKPKLLLAPPWSLTVTSTKSPSESAEIGKSKEVCF